MNKMMVMKVSKLLLLVGGLNWGLIGLGGFAGQGNMNVINWILGSWPMVEWAVYLLVGLAAVLMIVKIAKHRM
jgi:uncharacterized protein